MNPQTYTLNKRANYARVLSRNTKHGNQPYTYTNQTQARKKAAELTAAGVTCRVIGRYPFYIEILDAPTSPQEGHQAAAEITRTIHGTTYNGRPMRTSADRAALTWIGSAYSFTLPIPGQYTGHQWAEHIRQTCSILEPHNAAAAHLADALDEYQADPAALKRVIDEYRIPV